MSEQNRINQFQEYAQTIIEKLDSVPQQLSQQDSSLPVELDRCILNIRKAAEETIERSSSPVKIGVVGEFSSGKTLLIGSLLGYADALPVSENPTTGNVTAVHLVQQKDLQTTQFGSFTVEYLSREEVERCLSYMLQEAKKRAEAAGLDPDRLQVQVDQRLYEGILEWCKLAWNQTNNVELCYLLRELVWFVRTYQSYGSALCGKQYAIDQTGTEKGLQLAPPPQDFQNFRFEELPHAPYPLENAPQNLQAAFVQKSFPLIRRLNIEVRVSPQIWDLSALGEEQQFTLLDFPGLGAANSGVRDTYLSLRELEEVQTILIVLNGKSPGSDRANKLYTIMEQHKGRELQDRILVGVGRFDLLSLDKPQHLDELINNDSDDPFAEAELTDTSVLEKLPVLKTTIATAKAFTTDKKRIVLCSPLLGLADLAETYPTIQVGSEDFIASKLNYSEIINPSKYKQRKWKELSQKLQQSEPSSYLAEQLEDFGENGGISQMRAVILGHVAKHGLQQVYQDTRKEFEVVRQEQEKLKKMLEQIEDEGRPIPDSPNLQILRQTLENLIKIYSNFKEEFKFGKKPLKNRQGVPIKQVVKDEVIFQIFNWPQWFSLFNKMQDGTITVKQATQTNKQTKSIRDKIRKSMRNTTTYGKSEDFYNLFEKTLEENMSSANKSIEDGGKHLVNQLFKQTNQERDNLKQIISEEILLNLEDRFGETIEQLRGVLEANSSPETFWEEVSETIESDSTEMLSEDSSETNKLDTTLSNNSKIIFPLALPDKKRKQGLTFDWEPKLREKPGSHHVMLLRIRQEMINSASVHLIELVSQKELEINQSILEFLDDLTDCLEEISKEEDLLRAIAAGEPQQDPMIPILQTLSEVAEMPAT